MPGMLRLSVSGMTMLLGIVKAPLLTGTPGVPWKDWKAAASRYSEGMSAGAGS